VATGGAGLGLVLAVLLIRASGPERIGALIVRAGWWLPLVILLHTPQTLCSALGWGALLAAPERPSVRRLYLLRWIREAVNGLMPVAQIGGEVVRTRLLARGGVAMTRAAASCALDVTLELAAQVVFTLLGVGLLAAAAPRSPLLRLASASVVVLVLILLALVGARRLIGSGRLDAVGAWIARRVGRPLSGQPPAIGFRPSRRQQGRGFLWHLLSWLLGAVETWAALAALGLRPSVQEAVVVESLGQVVRAAAFAIPGAVGVQEGGLILICGIFGVAPAAAVAVSLVRRLREVALGAPGLLAWRLAERKAVA
jgi:putative membrane protein